MIVLGKTRTHMKTQLLTIALVSIISSAYSAEVDSFTRRNEHFEDMAPLINDYANKALKSSVEVINSQYSDCNEEKAEKKLYLQLRTHFANHTKGKLVKYLLHSDDVFKKITPLRESVYGHWALFDGMRLGSSSAHKREFPISPLIKVGDHLIGIDKLEHMFGMGRRYFMNYYWKGKSLKKVFKRGIAGEKFILGGQMFATGVFSFGDLGANFNGMRFWNHMLLKNDDVLGSEYNQGPYIKCIDKKFVVNTEAPLDFTYYVDESMDESINCPKFARKTAVKKFNKAIADLGMTCPRVKEDLEKAKKKYSALTPEDKKKRPISHWILNTDKVEDVSYWNEF
jgi:hypothetical protein